METTESCKQCEKLELHIQTSVPIAGPLELPNTYSKKTKNYTWKHTDMMAYALIPRSVQGSAATIDMFLCLDEDLLDDIDIHGYATKFIKEEIIPQYKSVHQYSIIEPVLGSPVGLHCWKVQHQSIIEESNLGAVVQE